MSKEMIPHNMAESEGEIQLAAAIRIMQEKIDDLKVLREDLRVAQIAFTNEKEGIIEEHQLEMSKALKTIDSMKVFEVDSRIMQEMTVMSLEDKDSTDVRFGMFVCKSALEKSKLRNEISALQIYEDKLGKSLVDKEKELIAISAAYSSIQLKVFEMNEITSVLKVQNKELEEDVCNLNNRLHTAISDVKNRHDENAQLASDIASLHAEQLQTKADNMISLERNDYLLLQVETMNSQIKALTLDMVEEKNANYLNEMQRIKKQEELLVTETKRNEEREEQLITQARKKSFHVIAMEAKQMKTERDAMQEKLDSIQLVSALRVDLEKQCAERMKSINEVKALKESNACFLQRTEELEVNMKRMDRKNVADKSALETAKKYQNMSQNIETERQELLLENKNLVIELNTSKQDLANLRGELGAFNEQMIWLTDMRSSLEEQNIELRKQLDSALGLQSQIDPLRQSLQEKESQLSTLTAGSTLDIRTFKESLQVEKEINVVLKAQNEESEQELLALQTVLQSKNVELDRYAAEREYLMSSVTRLETEKISSNKKAAKELNDSMSAQNTATLRMETSNTQCEVLTEQLRTAQLKHWAESKRFKEERSALLGEATSLSTELQENVLKLVLLEAEKAKIETQAKEEIFNSSQLAFALQGELEKRLNELTQSISKNKELDVYIDKEKPLLIQKIGELEIAKKNNEDTFKNILESDRAKLQEEMRKRIGKLKMLEAEKQELLQETHDLSVQNGSNQRELLILRGEVATGNERLNDMVQEIDSTKRTNTELLDELKAVARREEFLKNEMQRMEDQINNEDSRFEIAVKEVKKAGAQQVMELSNQLHGLRDDNERLKDQLSNAAFMEANTMAEVERYKQDAELMIQNRDDMQQQESLNMDSLRLELQEQRVRVKNIYESKSAMEVEMLNARIQLQKTEEELGKVRDRCNTSISKVNSLTEDGEYLKQVARDETRAAKITIDEMQAKVSYLENILSKQQAEMQSIVRDYSKVERVKINEVQQLRAQLDVSNHELSEMQPTIAVLRKENSDHKGRLERLQVSTTATVNKLLVELKSTEDALSSERKQSQQAVEGHRMQSQQVFELQSMLERAKENIAESVSRSKDDRVDRDLRVQQSEAEVERLKGILNIKESRLDDLERQHQENRSRLLEFSNKLEISELSTVEKVAALEQGREKIDRLERRLQTAIEGHSLSTTSTKVVGGGRVRVSPNSQVEIDYSLDQNSYMGESGLEERNISEVSLGGFNRNYHDERERNRKDQDDIYQISEMTSDQAPLSPTVGRGNQKNSQQSPTDRVAMALASRAIKDREKSLVLERQEKRSTYQSPSLASQSQPSEVSVMQKHQFGSAEDSIQRTEMYLRQKLKGGAATTGNDDTSHNSETHRSSFSDDYEEDFHLKPPNLSYRPLSSKHDTDVEYDSPRDVREQNTDGSVKSKFPNINTTSTKQVKISPPTVKNKQLSAEVRQNNKIPRNSNSKSDNNLIRSSKNQASNYS